MIMLALEPELYNYDNWYKMLQLFLVIKEIQMIEHIIWFLVY